MSNSTDIPAWQAVCEAAHEVAAHASWHIRLHASAAAVLALTGRRPDIVRVRAVAYNRGAVLRLGGALLPNSDAELTHFREQVGRAMLPLGYGAPHAVLTLDEHFMDLVIADGDAEGVIVRPLIGLRPARDARCWSVNTLRFGVLIAYELHELSDAIDATELSTRLARALSATIAARARWLLDSAAKPGA